MGGNKKVVKVKKPHSRHQRDIKKYLKMKQREPEGPSRRCPFNPSSDLPDVLKTVFLGIDSFGLVVDSYIWVCLKIVYPNYSHLIGIMIINHWV